MIGEGSFFREVADGWRETRVDGMWYDLRADERVEERCFERDKRCFES